MKPTKLFLFVFTTALVLNIVAAVAIGADASTFGDRTNANTARHETSPEAYLGVGVATLPAPLVAHLGDALGKGRGILVADVSAGSPAAQAGFKVHDVLITYDGHDLYSTEQLVKLVRQTPPGREVDLGYVRGGKAASAQVRLGEVPVMKAPESRLPTIPGFDRFLRLGKAMKTPFVLGKPAARQDEAPWTFQSMTVTKSGDGRYEAAINLHDGTKEVRREYRGSLEEIRDAVRNDDGLSEDAKGRLLNSLDHQPVFPESNRGMEDMQDVFSNWMNWFGS